MMRVTRLVCPCSAWFVLTLGCASTPLPPIGPGQVFQPDARETRVWQASRGAAREFLASGAVYQDEKTEEYVQSVLVRILGNDLSAYAPLEPRVHLIDSPVVNAFALPHGDIFIHTGMLGRIRNEAQLAMLLAHEVTHATHRHAYQEREDMYARSGAHSYISVLAAAGGVGGLVSGLSELITVAAISGYSRDNEQRADEVGLIRMAQAGYDVQEAPEMFRRMLDATDEKDRRWSALYATHPKMEERVKTCQELVTRLPAELLEKAHEDSRDRYLGVASDFIYEEVGRHVAQGKFDLALETLRFMKEARPDHAQALALLGDLYRARSKPGDRDTARKTYHDALGINPNYALPHRGLGLLCMKAGNAAEASQHLERYLAIAPTVSDAAYIRQCLEQLAEEN